MPPMSVDESYVVEERDVEATNANDNGRTVLRNIVTLVGAIITGMLALRFVLSLLGVNRGNPLASFVYDVTRPLVQPFFGLFNYQPQIGVARFEFETLIAILVYGLLFALVVRLIYIDRKPE